MRKITLYVSFAALASLVGACGTNPVTGKKEIQLVSEGWEVNTGKEYYAPTRQAQGGDYVVDPEVTRYVQSVGAKLAAVAAKETGRDLPYEFVVLNNSVPNAWALPGGKIAVNRGLLLELNDEAELAAVLGHEITHAAARHGAKSQERGMLAQAGLVAIAIGAGDEKHGDLIVGGAQLGLVMVTQKYGRDAELESDRYGMEYMAAAGYDPRAAVSLQETFVRLAKGRRQDWLSGLFASHPPSDERVEANQKRAEKLGAQGDRGAERYREGIATLLKTKDAYAAYDKGVAALKKGDAAQASAAADQALGLEPREAQFYALKGAAANKQGKRDDAIGWYDKAIERNAEYYEFWLARGLLRRAAGDARGARADLSRSNQLLPTAVANEALGNLALDGGDQEGAMRYLRDAAGSRTPEGRRAAGTLVRMVLARNPAEYVQTRAELDPQGRVVIAIRNAAPIAIADVKLVATRIDPATRAAVGSEPVEMTKTLDPGDVVRVPTRLGPLAGPKALGGIQIKVRSARAAE